MILSVCVVRILSFPSFHSAWDGCLGNILKIDGSVILLLDKEEPARIH